MEPTLETGSLILGLRLFGELENGDIIIFCHDSSYLVKRIAACEGDTLVHQNAAYLLNGHTRSCGGMNAERQARLNITGQRWWRLVPVRHVGYTTVEQTGKKQAVWL